MARKVKRAKTGRTHDTYATYRDRFLWECREFDPGLRKMGYQEASKEAVYFFHQQPRLVESINAAILFTEYGYYDSGCVTIFPENKKLLELLYRVNFEVTQETLVPKNSFVSFAWPKGTVIDGVEVPPCVMGHYSVRELIDLHSKYRREYGLNSLEFGHDSDDIDARHLVFSYQATETKWARLQLPVSRAAEAMTVETIQAFDTPSVYGSHAVIALDEDEYKCFHVLFRLCCTMCMYISDFPHAVVDGYPESMKGYARERHVNRTGVTIAAPTIVRSHGGGTTHASPLPHLRGPHTRTLRHEKFYRDGGTLRVIPVRGTWVNLEVDPKTVKVVQTGEK